MLSRLFIKKENGGRMEALLSDEDGRCPWQQLGAYAEAVGPNAVWHAEPIEPYEPGEIETVRSGA